MICQLLGHKEADLNDSDGVLRMYCTRCCRFQRDWKPGSATIDGFGRGIIWAFGTFGGALFTAKGVAGTSWEDALVIAGVGFFLALGGRTGEGKLDERKARS